MRPNEIQNTSSCVRIKAYLKAHVPKALLPPEELVQNTKLIHEHCKNHHNPD